MGFGSGKPFSPLFEKSVVKTEITPAPAQQHRARLQQGQRGFNRRQGCPGRMVRIHRDIFDKTEHGDSMAPIVVGREKSCCNFRAHGSGHGHKGGGAGKTVQTAHQQTAQDRPTADADAQGGFDWT